MTENTLNINTIKEYIKQNKVDWTSHCLNRLNQREISTKDVKEAINNGKIIEYYYDDFPYPSCLILGIALNSKIIHVVCGISNNLIHIITAYYPNIIKWENDMETRRKN